MPRFLGSTKGIQIDESWRAADQTFQPKVVVRGVITIMPFSPLWVEEGAIVQPGVTTKRRGAQSGSSLTSAVRSRNHSNATAIATPEPPWMTTGT